MSEEKGLVKQEGSILDLETNEFHTPTEERIAMANHWHGQAMAGAIITAMAIRRIFDEKLYLDLGCSSRDEYINRMLPFGRKQAYQYHKVAGKFAPYLESGESIEELGIRKLNELAKLDQPDIEALLEGKEIGEGDDKVSLAEIREASSREVSDQIKKVRQKYQAKVTQLEEEVLTLKAESEADHEKVVKAEQKLEEARSIEQVYGSKASLVADKRRRMAEANTHLDSMIETIMRSGVTEEDPDTLINDMLAFLRKLNKYQERIEAEYQDLMFTSEVE